jgi:hypothetical protein
MTAGSAEHEHERELATANPSAGGHVDVSLNRFNPSTL